MNENHKQRAPIRLRPARWQRDLKSIIKIEKAGFARPWAWWKFLQFSIGAGNRAFVAELGGQVVGYTLYECHSDCLHVAHIAVDPCFQSLGIGRRMIDSVCDQGLPVTLNVRTGNVRAQALYLQLGFHPVECLTSHYADGENAVVMQYAMLAAELAEMSLTAAPAARPVPAGQMALLS